VLSVGPTRRFELPAGAAEVPTDTRSLSDLAPLARMFGASAVQLPALVDAYRNDGGVAWSDYGIDMRESQAGGPNACGNDTSGPRMATLSDRDRQPSPIRVRQCHAANAKPPSLPTIMN
jgi:hypothetical protein